MILNYTAIDLETTGMHSKNDRIIEIGAVKVRNGEEKEIFSQLVNPGRELTKEIVNLTGITDDMLKGKRRIESVLPEFIDFCGDDILLGHNVMFDYGFIKQNAANINIKWERSGIDSLKIARKFLSSLESRKLDYLCSYYNIEDSNHHRALNGAIAASRLYRIMSDEFENEAPEYFTERKLNFSVKKQSPITKRQAEYLTDLLRYHNLILKGDIKSLTKSEASRLIDRILSEKGRI